MFCLFVELFDFVLSFWPFVYLIGMNYLDTKIFEKKNWGQQSVLNDTIRDIDDKTNIHLLDEKTDIDTYDDLCQFPDLKIKL